MSAPAGYVEVKDRIVTFREKHPDGCLQPINPQQPYSLEFIEVEGKPRCFIVYTAAAYRTPDDPRPGIGVAWEPFPGLTNFTRNSELMNAETSAWGRAIVAALAADAGPVASAEDVEARAGEPGIEPKPATKGKAKPAPEPEPEPKADPLAAAWDALVKIADIGGHKKALFEALGKPASTDAAFAAYKAMGTHQREALEAIASGNVQEVAE